jgi:hypothetical protein
MERPAVGSDEKDAATTSMKITDKNGEIDQPKYYVGTTKDPARLLPAFASIAASGQRDRHFWDKRLRSQRKGGSIIFKIVEYCGLNQMRC